MKFINQQIQANPRYAKYFSWAKLITVTGSAQILVQAVGLVSGILIIRLLPTEEYALYTLVNSMLGTMTILADGGIASGVMAQAGKVWKDEAQLGIVINTGVKLRRRFAIVSLLFAVPILLYLLLHHGASWLMAILIVASLIPAFNAALSDSLLEVAPKLRQEIKPLQKNQVAVGVFRLILTTLCILIFPYAYIVILATGLPRTWGNYKLRKLSSKYADLDQKPDPEVQKDILLVVKRILPGAIYFCISGQATIWLISLFGSTKSLAHVGGLSRLTTVLSVLTVIISTLFEPRFSRLANDKKIILLRFLQIQFVIITIGIFIMALVWLFPDQITSVLGHGYEGLRTEVLLITGSSYLGFISGSVYRLSAARGIVPPPFIFFSSLIVVQVAFFFMVDYSSIKGALFFGVYTSLFSYLFRLLYFFIWMKREFTDKETL